MLPRLLAALDVDPHQWRVLLRTYLRIDSRTAGGAILAGSKRRSRRIPMGGGLLVMALGSLMFAFLAAVLEDPLLSGMLLVSYGAINTAMLLLIEFTGVVIAPEDYGVLGHRPVSSRTYFMARLSSVLIYVTLLSVALAAAPGLALAWWRGLGAWAWPGTIAAVVFCNATITIVVVAAYVAMLSWVRPQRLRAALSHLHLVSATFFYLSYFLATRVAGSPAILTLRLDEAPWLWANPATWYATWITLGGTGAHPRAAAAAALLTLACVPLAAGRVSLEYASRLGETSMTSGRRAGAGPWRSLPGFRNAEARAVALLVRAQYRFDQRFRLAILGMLPLLGFYVLLGLDNGALADPFSPGRRPAGSPLYMAIAFLPMTLHGALHATPSWRAAWIFFASPALPSRLIVATKNFVTIFFLGGFLLVLGTLWSVYFDRVWHALVHVAIIGAVAHMFLQLTVIVSPTLPFSTEPKQAEGSSRMLKLVILGSAVGSFLPLALPFFYRGAVRLAVLVAVLAAVTVALEYTLRRRATASMAEMEFRS